MTELQMLNIKQEILKAFKQYMEAFEAGPDLTKIVNNATQAIRKIVE